MLGKYEVSYFRCVNCGFMQTEKPYWLKEAYNKAISSLDVGMLSRNLSHVHVTESIINTCFDRTARFLDYAGGYGIFVRLMRDRGYDFYRQDEYCENIFAIYHDVEGVGIEKNGFELVTAFEVFEHLADPLADLKKILAYSSNVLFSTVFQDGKTESLQSWWYLVPQSGQHVSFYTRRSLEIIAEHFGCHLHTNSKDLHLFTDKKITNPFSVATGKKNLLVKVLNRLISLLDPSQTNGNSLKSLLDDDFELAVRRLKEQE